MNLPPKRDSKADVSSVGPLSEQIHQIHRIRPDPFRRRANTRNVSFRISLRWPIHIINPLDKTKLSYSWVDFQKVLPNNFPWPVGFAVGKVELSRLTSLALALATSSLEITFSLPSRVINKSGIKKRSTCGKSNIWEDTFRPFTLSIVITFLERNGYET